MCETGSTRADLLPQAAPYIERRFRPVTSYFDDQGNRFQVASGWGQFSRLFVRGLQFERPDGTWSDPRTMLDLRYDTGAFISILPREFIDGLKILTVPVRDVGLRIGLSGAFRQGRATFDEKCPLVYVLFGFSEYPDVKFPALCAISDKVRYGLIADNWFFGNFDLVSASDIVTYENAMITVTGYRLILQENNRSIQRNQRFEPPVFPG